MCNRKLCELEQGSHSVVAPVFILKETWILGAQYYFHTVINTDYDRPKLLMRPLDEELCQVCQVTLLVSAPPALYHR